MEKIYRAFTDPVIGFQWETRNGPDGLGKHPLKRTDQGAVCQILGCSSPSNRDIEEFPKRSWRSSDEHHHDNATKNDKNKPSD